MKESFVHPYMPNSAPANKNAMLKALGIDSIEEIYGKNIPEALRFRGEMKLPSPIPEEYRLREHVFGILNRNASCEEYRSFLGAGCYNHYVPAICDEINSRAEFLTGYCGDTYSDHGKMQAIFEYTSMMGELLNMDVVSYTLYDGGQACCSALSMAVRIQKEEGHEERTTLLVPSTMNPEILSQLKNYCAKSAKIELLSAGQNGRINLEELKKRLSKGDVAAVFFENPSYLGFFEDQAEELCALAHCFGAYAVVSPDVASLGVISPPADYGADIVCGDIQPLGMHMQFGGGCAGFIASRYEEKYIQQYPTYLYSLARTSKDGEYGWGRALNYRCSHGAREKAHEYFGTETGLWSITAAVYLALMGPQGMYELGEHILKKCNYLVKTLEKVPGLRVNPFGGTNFQEVVVNFDRFSKTSAEVNKALLKYGIFGGKSLKDDFPELGDAVLFAVTEKTAAADIDSLYDALLMIGSEDE